MTTDDFDERAATWDDDPDKHERARMVAERLRDEVVLTPSMRLLEYGAGTGLLATELRAGVGAVTVTDRSEGMLEVLRAKADSGPLAGAEVHRLDLTVDPPLDARFDVVTSLMVLHHVGDHQRVLRGLFAMTAPDGVVCLIDLDAEDGSFHGPDFEGPRGFEREHIATLLGEAGFGQVKVVDGGAVSKDGEDYPLFLALARP